MSVRIICLLVLMTLQVGCGVAAQGELDEVPIPAAIAAVEPDDLSSISIAKATASAAAVKAHDAAQLLSLVATTSTARAQATSQQLELQATRIIMAATATALTLQTSADEARLAATQASAIARLRATEEAFARDGVATVVAAQVTAEAIALQQHTERSLADWQSTVAEPLRIVGLLLLGLTTAALLTSSCLRIADALLLRLRIVRDITGQLVVFPEPDRAGRQSIIMPWRSPGAILQLTPGGLTAHQVSADAIDATVTEHAQILEGVSLAPESARRSAHAVRPTPQIRFVPQLPEPQVADTHAMVALDADWHARGNHD